MDPKIKQVILTIVAVVCVCIACFIVYKSCLQSDLPAGEGEVAMLCTSCGYTTAMTRQKLMDTAASSGEMTAMGPPALKCPKCSVQTLVTAQRCSKCKAIYLPDYSKPNADKCPKCGYREAENSTK
jgi:hypothetical protein